MGRGFPALGCHQRGLAIALQHKVIGSVLAALYFVAFYHPCTLQVVGKFLPVLAGSICQQGLLLAGVGWSYWRTKATKPSAQKGSEPRMATIL